MRTLPLTARSITICFSHLHLVGMDCAYIRQALRYSCYRSFLTIRKKHVSVYRPFQNPLPGEKEATPL